MKIFQQFSLTFLLLFSLQASGQLLWEISGNGLEEPSFLYGTMHVSDERVFMFADSVMAKFHRCDAFAGELDFDPAMVMQMLPHLFMPGDTTLQDLFSEEDYALVSQKLQDELGIMAGFAERMKPIFISVLLAEAGIKGKTSDESGDAIDMPGVPLDLHFQNVARDKGMEVIGLETFEEQISVFNAIPLVEQADMLIQSLDEAGGSSESPLDQLIDIYTAQNIDSLYRMTTESLDPELNEQMLGKRNRIMANRIEGFIKVQKVFIGVGAAHLAGYDGLIALLEEKGYTLSIVE